MPSPFFCLFFFHPPPQFSKDVLVNIYSAYIDNFLNAKDAVRIAKEARPAFIKFLEVGVGATGGAESGLMGLNWLSMAKLGFFQPLLLWGAWCGVSQHHSGGCQKECPRPQSVVAAGPRLVSQRVSHLTGPSLSPLIFFFFACFCSKACGRTRRSRLCPT